MYFPIALRSWLTILLNRRCNMVPVLAGGRISHLLRSIVWRMPFDDHLWYLLSFGQRGNASFYPIKRIQRRRPYIEFYLFGYFSNTRTSLTHSGLDTLSNDWSINKQRQPRRTGSPIPSYFGPSPVSFINKLRHPAYYGSTNSHHSQ